MNKIYLTLLFLVGLINFLPIIGVISLDRINQSYGLTITDSNVAILLRHRALLFGLIGGFIIYSVFNPHQQMAAIAIAAISMLGYLYLFWSTSEPSLALLNVAKADIIGVILLLIAISIKLLSNHR